MKRIVILGNAGAGKSELARRIGAALSLPVIHLDTIFWRPGWAPTPREEFRSVVASRVMEGAWVMDGNYMSSLQDRLNAADTVLFIDFPRWRCLVRILKRVLTAAGQDRGDLPAGCRETFLGNFELVRWMWAFPHKDGKSTLEMINRSSAGKMIVILRNPRQVSAFLADLKN